MTELIPALPSPGSHLGGPAACSGHGPMTDIFFCLSPTVAELFSPSVRILPLEGQCVSQVF